MFLKNWNHQSHYQQIIQNTTEKKKGNVKRKG